MIFNNFSGKGVPANFGNHIKKKNPKNYVHENSVLHLNAWSLCAKCTFRFGHKCSIPYTYTVMPAWQRFSTDLSHCILLNSTSLLAMKFAHKGRDMNRDGGFSLSRLWKPPVHSFEGKEEHCLHKQYGHFLQLWQSSTHTLIKWTSYFIISTCSGSEKGYSCFLVSNFLPSFTIASDYILPPFHVFDYPHAYITWPKASLHTMTVQLKRAHSSER